MKNNLKNINWVKIGYSSLLLLSIFGINFLTLNNSILSDLGQAGKNILSHLGFMPFIFVISLAIIAFDLVRNISWKFVGKLSLGYIIYLIVAYFLLITRNLNNEKFKLWDLEGNGFWQVDFLPILIPLVISAFLIKALFDYLKPKRLRGELLKDCQTSNLLLAGLLASVAVNDGHYISILREGFINSIKTNQFNDYLHNVIIALVLSLIGLILISYTAFQAGKDIIQNQPSLSLAFTTSALLAVIFNYTLQLGVEDDAILLGKYVFPGATLYQICLLLVVYLFVYCLINRYLISTIIIVSSGIVISVVNAVKEGMRSEPLLITDFVWLQQVDLLVSFVNIKLVVYTVLSLLLAVLIYLFLRKRIFPGRIINRKRIRFVLLTALAFLSVSVFTVFRNERDAKIVNGIPIISKVNNWYDINWMGFSTSARYKSLMYVWTKQLTKSIMDTPNDYSQEKMNEVSKKYTKLAKKINQSRKENISDQTVIYLLSESFSDPNRVDGVTLSREVIPNIKQIKQTTTSGLMKSDGYGGGTANMEFQALTGLPFYNFSSSVSVLYTEVAPEMSIFPSLSSQFKSKNRLVLHPSGANNYGRKNIYKNLGFSDLVFTTDSKDKFSNKKFTGVSVSDETLYNNILQRLDTTQNQFFSAITMQNHVPWSVSDPADVSGSGKGFTDGENNNLSNYARLLTHTDNSTKAFLDKLSKINKKVTVVFYGDHLPGFYPDSAFSSNAESKYQTDYFIWSNFETPKMNYPLVNSSDFTAELLKQTNSRVSPYYALLTEVLDNASVDKKKLNKNQKKIAEDLKLIQYDITLGKGYILKHKDFFKIGKNND
ncbi:LTA synthase family protein [Streptococcus ratti]|uniref:Sulfatase N-terminal domain-containing protein n=1 Tax=Streptococcus ratti FA-1 = DSM 20564 TaxID=699248 RepID=A0ABP2QXU3_STRRT|nr:LTA synthase family protein [Streptococcus ratti]EJN93687.1 hypothetical protein SRA_04096 [Streptococcus ratti FA-1 = DSM 20564]EMP71248.1 hypothetical protein D822_01879 [Streptococcus ratti FA-1 = DSM 20564]QEY07547.1 sulfatase-like hydrolase/transferase [Streptococcus ratti]VEI59999.1 Glycerol phosphate lipoteichoic acid synthase [Streptococcus mutans]